MGKDYKIGLICGLVAAVAVIIWLATRPSLSTRGQIRKSLVASAPTSPSAPAASDFLDQSNQNGRARQPQAANTPEPQPVAPPQQVEPPRPSEPPPVASRQADAPAAASSRTHVVQNGETLSSISQQYYGTPNAWQRIVKANAGVIKNPNVVPPGTRLIIP
jgi:nucleoid-associated protein YgaU